MPMGDFGEEDRLDQYWSLKDLREEIDKNLDFKRLIINYRWTC